MVRDVEVVLMVKRQVHGFESLREIGEAELALRGALEIEDPDTAVPSVSHKDKAGPVGHGYAPGLP